MQDAFQPMSETNIFCASAGWSHPYDRLSLCSCLSKINMSDHSCYMLHARNWEMGTWSSILGSCVLLWKQCAVHCAATLCSSLCSYTVQLTVQLTVLSIPAHNVLTPQVITALQSAHWTNLVLPLLPWTEMLLEPKAFKTSNTHRRGTRHEFT